MKKVDWIEIKSQEDIDELMKMFGGFHDSCLREIHLWTDIFVDSDLRMSGILTPKIKARMLFQRQWTDPSAIEFFFEEITELKITRPPENYGLDIYGATLFLRDNLFYWAEVEDWSPDSEEKNQVTWIGAKKVKWRDRSSWMGEELRYGSTDD